MGVSIQFESDRVEFWAIYGMERDEDVLEFYEQSFRIPLELWLHIVPVTCGAGARLFENVPNLQLEPLEISGTPLVTHIRYRVVKK